MPSSYLVAGEYATYNVASGVTAATVTQASALVDQVLGRPEGLVWTPDGAGAPAYMAALTPEVTFTLQGAISAGQNVAVTVLPAIVTPDMIGDVLVLDRATPSITEACTITATTGNNGLTFKSAAFAHALNATADRGLLIREERPLPNKRSIARISRLPTVGVRSLLGRYGYGRRSDQVGGLYQEMNLLAAIQTFGGPPLWIATDPSALSLSQSTGEIWVPAGMLMAYYSEVRVYYLAGFSASAIPSPVKQATANIANVLAGLAEIPAQAKMMRAGDTAIERFSASNIDVDTKNMLEPFKARIMF